MIRTTADKIFSEIIRTRDNWTCQRCATVYNPNNPTSRKGLHCSHYIGRSRYGTRFDEDNCIALCYGCHQYFTSHPIEHTQFFLDRMGEEKLLDMKAKSNARLPMPKSWYTSKDHQEQLKNRLKELQC